MNQQNQRISLTKRGGDTYTVNIIKKDKNIEKKLELGLFGFQSYLTLTYRHKFKSEQYNNKLHIEEAHFGLISAIYYALINYRRGEKRCVVNIYGGAPPFSALLKEDSVFEQAK